MARAVPEQETQLSVSRELVRVVYAVEKDSVWTWPANQGAPYRWIVRVPGTAGPLMVFAATNRFDTLTSPRYTSLDSLMTVSWAGVCSAHLFLDCIGEASIRAAGNRAMVTVSDTAMIRKLFALRPDSVQAYTHSYLDTAAVGKYRMIPVQYVDPQLPSPDSAARAERNRDVVAYDLGSQSLRREIRTANRLSGGPQIWLQLGDTLSLSVDEVRCWHDVCTSTSIAGQWHGTDSSVVSVERANPPGTVGEIRQAGALQRTPISISQPPAVKLTGLKLGTATVVAGGLDSTKVTHGRVQPPTSVTTSITVIPRIASLELRSARDTVLTWEQIRLSVTVRDTAGNIISGLPISVSGAGGNQNRYFTTIDSVVSDLGSPARIDTIIASFQSWRDSIVVVVRDAPYPLQLREQYADSSIAALLRFDRETGLANDLFARILRQETGRSGRARLDSLADSLASRVIAGRENSVSQFRGATTLDPVRRSVFSGIAGRPYVGAQDILVRIYREAQIEWFRSFALQDMCYAFDSARGVRFVQEIAVGRDGIWPARAVQALISASDARIPAATAALRALTRSGRIVDSAAARLLTTYNARGAPSRG